MSQEHSFRIHKFIITPILSVYDDKGNLVKEKKLSSVSRLACNNDWLKYVAERLEQKLYEEASKDTPPEKE